MPIPRKPPDKPYSSLFKNVSSAVNSLLEEKKNQVTISVDERISNSLFPSNLDSSVSADNLKNELLGKSTTHSNQHLVKEFHCKHNTNIVDNRELSRKTSKEHAKKVFDAECVEKDDKKRKSFDPLPENGSVPLPPRPKIMRVKKPCDTKDLVPHLSRLLKLEYSMSKPKFSFDVSPLAAYKNYALLLKEKFNLHKLLNAEGEFSITSYGSEFKNVEDLQDLLKCHPRWKDLKARLRNGSTWKLKELEESFRKNDLIASIKRGNHKSADIHRKFLADALSKEVKKDGYLFYL